MNTPYATRISGTGSSFPERRYTNGELVVDLAKRGVETNDDWIRERTGIRERRISRPEVSSEHCSSLAANASRQALEMAGKKAEDLDFILFSTSTPDMLLPSSACHLQNKIGAKKAWALDVNAACSGFLYALATADQFIRTGHAQTGLVVGADVLSTIINWEDRGSCILFGDGAGAAVVERTAADAPHRIISSRLRSDGDLWEVLYVKAGGSAYPASTLAPDAPDTKMVMNGKEIYKFAVKTLTDLAADELARNKVTVEDLDWLVPHQANLRIIEAVADRLKLPMDKVILNIDRFGNTSSATVPTALDEAVRTGRIRKGQTVLFDVFGAGVTSGSLLMRWG